ncbi:hypothetical protein QJQ45_014961 [Haematococcus lacustris]|nr:hypothetical protein QJQ45_014961 [Haematococcus lacustris]
MGDDLMAIGEHCSVPECGQRDFLPFKCDCCSRVFCLQHRTYSNHACEKAGEKQLELIVCPLCAKSVRLNGRDANIAFEEHTKSGCDPQNYNKVHKKPRCPVHGCKEKLATSNTYHCKLCQQRVCLKHRHACDHGCDEAQAMAKQLAAASARQRGFLGQVQSALRFPAASSPAAAMGSGKGAVAAASGASDPGNTVKGSAERRKQMLQAQQSGSKAQGRQAVLTSETVVSNPLLGSRPPPNTAGPQQLPSSTPLPAAAAALGAAAQPEVCPQCSARFASVDRLIQHVEEWHPSASSGSRQGALPVQGAGQAHRHPSSSSAPQQLGGGGAYPGRAAAAAAAPWPATAAQELFRCPGCGQEFTDAVLLVGHAQRCSAAGGRRAQPATGQGQDGSGNCSVQ